MGIFLVLLSVTSFALSNNLWTYPLKKLNFLQVIILRSALTSLLFGAAWLVVAVLEFSPDLVRTASTIEILKAIALCAFSYFGLFFYVQSLKFEKVSIAVPVSNISGAFGIATAIVFFNEAVTMYFLLALLAFSIGVMIIENKRTVSFKFSKGVALNLAAAVCWGISFALFAIPLKQMGVLTFSFILEATVLVCSLLLFRMENLAWSIPIKMILDKHILLLGVLGFCGVVFYNGAFFYLPVSTVSLFGILTPVVSVILSSALLRESLQPRQYIGVLIIIIGMALLTITNS